MTWYQTAWSLIRDVLLTGTGLALIISQMMAADPSATLVGAGLMLTIPAAASHTAAVLSAPSVTPPGPSSSSSSLPSDGAPAPQSSSLPTSGGTDAQGGGHAV